MTRVESLGRVLFQIRSWSPLPVVAAVLALLAFVPGPAPTPAMERVLVALGLLACALGQALRAWVLGLVQAGTSGQNDYLEAVHLNTAGPYAHVRNPLYVGNFLICLGLALAAGNLWAALLGLGFFAFEYAFIVPAEEGFLRERFGAAYDAYCAAVPRWLWRLTPAPSSQTLPATFDWRRALKKEHNPFCAWASGMLVLVGLRAWMQHRAEAMPTLAILAATELALLLAYVGVKGWKRRWWLAGGSPS
ncbi:MAG: isoprenylcysteine carboxylmethyltransferase family protein [Deltaproteobacteria bacterium]|nr:isoprenylcysteine carboxylmethyltransferase family protein [Deltaproteobacteria bacterium]